MLFVVKFINFYVRGSDTACSTNDQKNYFNSASFGILDQWKPTRQYLTLEQLLTLTTVYFKTPYPDKLMKEHLVTKTGLSGKVITRSITKIHPSNYQT